MCWKLRFCLPVVAAISLASQLQAALVWTVGIDDNDQPTTGTGGGPNANFVQENDAINPLPGSATSTPVPRGADNDYYLAGVYSTTIPGNTAFYGDYAPVGVVSSNEDSAERAFADVDNDLRYHFNLATTLSPTDLLSVTFDAYNLDDLNATNTDPRYGIEIYFNGVRVMDQVIIRIGDVDRNFTTPLFSQASVNAVRGPGADNIVSLRGINYNNSGGGNWMGIDFVELDSQPVPEPSSTMMILCGAGGLIPFLRHRRA